MARVKLSNFYVFSLVFLITVVNLVKCNVPVLLWESSSISDKDDLIPALYQLDSDEFSNHVVKKIHQHKPLVVLFLEESLSVEDFSWKDDHEQGSFPQLQNLTSMSAKTEFITSVDDPILALKDLAESQEYSWVKYDNSKLPVKSRVVLEVTLEDPSADEDRPELLRRHDTSIAEIYSKLLSQYSHIVALFTGKYSSWVEPEYNRVRREANENATSSAPFDTSVMFNDNTHALLMSSKSPTISMDSTTITLSNASLFPDMKKDERTIVANFPNKAHLRFTFTKSNGYWKLASIILNDSIPLTGNVDISRPLGTPFIYNQPIEFSNGTTKLRFEDIQIQAYASNKLFGPSPPIYFTYPILMVIFITVILGLILSWAIIMMMDIRTMDRFDDPKGKTITVAQGE